MTECTPDLIQEVQTEQAMVVVLNIQYIVYHCLNCLNKKLPIKCPAQIASFASHTWHPNTHFVNRMFNGCALGIKRNSTKQSSLHLSMKCLASTAVTSETRIC